MNGDRLERIGKVLRSRIGGIEVRLAGLRLAESELSALEADMMQAMANPVVESLPLSGPLQRRLALLRKQRAELSAMIVSAEQELRASNGRLKLCDRFSAFTLEQMKRVAERKELEEQGGALCSSSRQASCDVMETDLEVFEHGSFDPV